MALRSMLYFEDAEEEATPELVASFPSLVSMKSFLIKAVTNFKFETG